MANYGDASILSFYCILCLDRFGLWFLDCGRRRNLRQEWWQVGLFQINGYMWKARMSHLLRIFVDDIYGHPPYGKYKLTNHPKDRTQAHGLSKLPIGTSRFCLARLDEKDNLFMTGGTAEPPPSPVKPSKVYLYR